MDSCPTKSVAAGEIEDSVIAQLRIALNTSDNRALLHVSDADWEAFDAGSSSTLVRSVVDEIGYDGATGGVSLKLRIQGEQG